MSMSHSMLVAGVLASGVSAFPHPSPAEIEKLACEVASKHFVEERATGAVCGLIHKKFPKVPEEGCQQILEKLWEAVEKRCPNGNELQHIPGKDEIEKVVCEVASKKQIEDKATGEICKLVKEKLHWVPDCEGIVEKIWDKVVSKCPKGYESTFPGKDQIEKVVCEVASQKQIEDKATAEICKLVKEKLHWVPDCEGLLEKVWDKVVSKCPKGAELKSQFPGKDEIEKVVCEVASQKQIEDKATGEICKLVKEKLHWVPDCEGLVEKVWDKVVSKCPKGAEVDHFHFPGKKIEKVVCEIASKQQIEDKATGEICKELKKKIPFIPDCEGLLDKVWDKVVAKCPKSDDIIV